MTAVLLHSIKEGSTGWISLRRGNHLRVAGMEEGDLLMGFFKPQGDPLSFAADGEYLLPASAGHVRIEHQEIATRMNGGGVNVDLVKVEI